MKKNLRVKRSVLRDLVRRVVKVAHPEKIILFGSAARGKMGPNSDVDLLVVRGGRYHRGRLVEAIYMNLEGLDIAVDVVLATPDDLEKYRDCQCLVYSAALREGKVIYAA
jgi:predicted nucleotidyltransferase